MNTTQMTLYDISGRFFDLLNADDLTEEEMQEQHNELMALVGQKAPSLIAHYRNTSALIDSAKQERDRLDDIIRTAEAGQKRYKEYIKGCMEEMQIVKIETAIGTLRISKNPMSVSADNIEVVPNAFTRAEYTLKGTRDSVRECVGKIDGDPEKIDVQLAKKLITDHFKDTGEWVDGVTLNLENTRLDVK